VANLSGAPGDGFLSLGWKLAGFAGGAVPTVAFAWPNRAIGAGLFCPKTPARSMQFLRCQRFSRLCVLINPCPAVLEIHPDLAGYGFYPIAAVPNRNYPVVIQMGKTP